MREIDEEYNRRPFLGSRKIRNYLNGLKKPDGSYKYKRINRKKVQRLMRFMGIEAIYPKPYLSRPENGARKYPYLLRNLEIDRPDMVWCTDITYIRLAKGFAYLTVIMDWYSRYVISRELSNTLDSDFCISALERALMKDRVCQIFNSDQGSQYTSDDFTDVLKDRQIQISMDGRGRAMDNIFVERLWRSVKYEEVYLHDYQTMQDAYEGLRQYFEYYNNERQHQSLGYKTPNETYQNVTSELSVLAA
jgi:putative transposase